MERIYEIIKQDPKHDKTDNYDWVTKDKKGGHNLRQIWQQDRNKDIPIGKWKWIDKIELPDNMNWKTLYQMGEKCKVDIRSKYVQHQVVHRTVMTDRKLLQFNIKDTKNCDFYGKTEIYIPLTV